MLRHFIEFNNVLLDITKVILIDKCNGENEIMLLMINGLQIRERFKTKDAKEQRYNEIINLL